MIPYSRQNINQDDIDAVVDALRGEYLTTGPLVTQFEQAVCDYTGAKYGVAVSSGTAALHCAMDAIRIVPGDEVIVPAISFVATANAVRYCGGTPIFCDVGNDLSISPTSAQKLITQKTKAIIAVDYAGKPAKYKELKNIAQSGNQKIYIVADACHSLGASYLGNKVGTLADITCLSFHPVKSITTGEGGMCMTNDEYFYESIRRFSNHGMVRDTDSQTASYDVPRIGYNYRLTDIQSALGISQLKRLTSFMTDRDILYQTLQSYIHENISEDEITTMPVLDLGVFSANHLFPVFLNDLVSRNIVFKYLREHGIRATIHYQYMPSFSCFQYTNNVYMNTANARDLADRVLSLPLYTGMTNEHMTEVQNRLSEALYILKENKPR